LRDRRYENRADGVALHSVSRPAHYTESAMGHHAPERNELCCLACALPFSFHQLKGT